MSIHEISYLSRYLAAIIFIVYIWLQLRLSIKELRWDMKNRVHPVKGVFLLSHQPGEENGSFRGVPLYHTTCLGRSPSCDIPINRETISKRHAIIYLYDDIWFIRPVGNHSPVFINGVRIIPPTPLEDQDIVTVGDQNFTFIQEKHIQPAELPLDAGQNRKSKPTGGWLAANLFTILGSLLLVFLVPQRLQDLRLVLGFFFLGFFVLINLYYWLLPVILRSADRIVILCMMFLSMLGILIQSRLTLTAIIPAGSKESAMALTAAVLGDLSTQGISLFLGLILFPVIAILVARTRLLEPLSVICGIATPLLLIATLAFGSGGDAYGATLWINIGGMSIQLTEFAKITYLIVLASFFKNRPSRRNQLIFAIWAGIVFFLIMLLPDMGSAMILLPTTLLVFVVMTSEYWTTLLILLSGSTLGAFAIAFFPHVQRRLAGWTSLWSEVNDSNRQVVYGLQAIARGGLLGRGVANGSPGGIPLASSDMVFSIVCEEMGMIAGLGIVLIFIILWLRAARTALTAPDGFSSGLVLGIGTLFFMEAVIVIAGVTGLMPLTGATLPLIAKGGSSVLAKLILFAIWIGLSARRAEVNQS